MHAQVTLGDGRVLVIGGLTGAIPGKPTDACDLIDLSKPRIEKVGSLPHPVGLLTAHVLPDGRVIAIGWQDGFALRSRAQRPGAEH